jgi:ribosomal-protein-alanine N-acetyltransferase
MARVEIRPPSRRFEAEFLAAARRSRALHRPWVHAPATREAFALYLKRHQRPTHAGHFLVERSTQQLLGVINLTEIVWSSLRSAYLGYYLFVPHQERGYMTEGLGLVLRRAFGELGLHRVEANIQPGNQPSLRLVERLGFRREGFSPRYLKIGGRWRDHERWALLAEEWRSRPDARSSERVI